MVSSPRCRFLVLTCLLATLSGMTFGEVAQSSGQQITPAPDRRPDEGLGPFQRLVIQDAILIDGTGAPPVGPVSIVIAENRIESIRRRVDVSDADHVIDASGMYVLPGFVDMHAHAGSVPKAPETEYVYKLWLAHGVTTVRGVPLGSLDFTIQEKERSAANEIVAPRIFNYQRPPANLKTPEEAQEWVRQAPLRGIDGLKLNSYPPPIMAALLTEANRLGLGSTAHLAQTGVAQMNALDAARLGLGTVTHFYGHFEALLKDHVVQPYPADHNYANEQDRFGQVARLWDKIHTPGSAEWQAYLQEHKKLGTVFDPTMNIYAAGRDVMRARTAEWHDQYTLPSLFEYFEPSLANHGSYWFDWTTWDEVAWRNFYRVWMQLINDYKKIGGRVTVGSDSGFIYKTFGFGYIEELELLQEAGFHPLEVIQCATMNGALTLHEPAGKALEFGIVRPGLLADLIIVPENPIQNLKVLYGTGTIRLNEETGQVERVGGVQWTIKDGIVYDAKALLADVAQMVADQKAALRQSSAVAEEDLTDGPNRSTVPRDSGSATKPQNEPTEERGTSNEGDGAGRSAELTPTPQASAETSAANETPKAVLPRDGGTPQSVPGDAPPTPERAQLPDDEYRFFDRKEFVLVANADWTTLFTCSKSTPRWLELNLEEPIQPDELTIKDSVVCVRRGNRLFAYSAESTRWGEFPPQADIAEGTQTQVAIGSDVIIARCGKWLGVFRVSKGTWSFHETERAKQE